MLTLYNGRVMNTSQWTTTQYLWDLWFSVCYVLVKCFLTISGLLLDGGSG